MSTPDTFRDDVAALFRARPNQWIDGLDVATVGGAYAWRSRVSNCRTELGMVIENRVRTVPGKSTRVSEYRFVPNAGLGCTCAQLGKDAPCGWCDGPDRD